MSGPIDVRGARENNLRSLSCTIPKNQLVVVTGPSGSGKSSFVYDTLYRESQRRYQQLGASLGTPRGLKRPNVDSISHLPFVTALDRVPRMHWSMSVLLLLGVYRPLSQLFLLFGEQHCLHCGAAVRRRSRQEMLALLEEQAQNSVIAVLSPWAPLGDAAQYERQGLSRYFSAGEFRFLSDYQEHDDSPELLVDVLPQIPLEADVGRRAEWRARAFEALCLALEFGDGRLLIRNLVQEGGSFLPREAEALVWSERALCESCEAANPVVTESAFSFYQERFACRECRGRGLIKQFASSLCFLDCASRFLSESGFQPWRSKQLEPKAKQRAGMLEVFGLGADSVVGEIPEETLERFLFGSCGERCLQPSTDELLAPKEQETESAFWVRVGALGLLRAQWKRTASESIRSLVESFCFDETCPACKGSRVDVAASKLEVAGRSFQQAVTCSLEELRDWLSGAREQLGLTAVQETHQLSDVVEALDVACRLGLSHLNGSRSGETLSSGEAQRIQLARFFATRLGGVLCVLDEPSRGLHPKDQLLLLPLLRALNQGGNSVLCVEHSNTVLEAADWMLVLGPGGGTRGGELTWEGIPGDLSHAEDRNVSSASSDERADARIELCGVRRHVVSFSEVVLPLGKLVSVVGVSGSGKSTLLFDVLAPALQFILKSAGGGGLHDGQAWKLGTGFGAEELIFCGAPVLLEEVIVGRRRVSERQKSTVGTLSGVLTPIRKLLAELPESKVRGFDAGAFSHFQQSGWCVLCQGLGSEEFVTDAGESLLLDCAECSGKRYRREVLEIRYRGRTFSELLELTAEELFEVFSPIPSVKRLLSGMRELGLGYLTLGQSASTLSSGERQRLELLPFVLPGRKRRALFLFDEPSRGLHDSFSGAVETAGEVELLYRVLRRLVKEGHSVVMAEHHPRMIFQSDWVLDLGLGGDVTSERRVLSGRPDELRQDSASSLAWFSV